MQLIKDKGNISIYLKYLPKTLAKRLAKSTSRPLLKELKKEDLEDFIRKHLFERNAFYTQATHSLAMDELTKEESLQHDTYNTFKLLTLVQPVFPLAKRIFTQSFFFSVISTLVPSCSCSTSLL